MTVDSETFPLASLSFDLPSTSRVSAGGPPPNKKHQRKLANMYLNFDNLALSMLPVDKTMQTGPREVIVLFGTICVTKVFDWGSPSRLPILAKYLNSSKIV